MSSTTIVIADDHAIVRKSLRLLLEGDTALQLIGEASDGLEAIEAIHMLHPDVLLMDINMPQMTGLEALKRLRAEKNPVAIILLSNHTDASYIETAMRWGADAFVAKSSGLEALMEALHSVGKVSNQNLCSCFDTSVSLIRG